MVSRAADAVAEHIVNCVKVEALLNLGVGRQMNVNDAYGEGQQEPQPGDPCDVLPGLQSEHRAAGEKVERLLLLSCVLLRWTSWQVVSGFVPDSLHRSLHFIANSIEQRIHMNHTLDPQSLSGRMCFEQNGMSCLHTRGRSV